MNHTKNNGASKKHKKIHTREGLLKSYYIPVILRVLRKVLRCFSLFCRIPKVMGFGQRVLRERVRRSQPLIFYKN